MTPTKLDAFSPFVFSINTPDKRRSSMITDKKTDKVRARIALYISGARMEKCWSMRRLAEESGVDVGNVFRIEDGTICPRADTLNALCNALGIQITFPLPF